MLPLILLPLIAFFSVLFFVSLSARRKIPSNIPCPPGVPILGHALEFTSSSDLIHKNLEYMRKYGGVFQLQLGPTLYYINFASSKTVEYILSNPKHLDKTDDYRFLRNWLGTGLITSTGTKWKNHRRIITPTLHFKILEGFVDVFNSTGNVLIEKLRKEVGKESFDILPLLSLYTLDAICETAMGVSINAQGHPTSEYVRCVKEVCKIVTDRAMSLIEQSNFLYKFTGDYAKEQKALKVLHGFTTSVIKKKKQELLENTSNSDGPEDVCGVKKKKAFLDLLLEFSLKEKDPLSDEELREEVDTFMFAGHDTTATAISFAVYCLAEDPHVQKAAHEEQISIFGGNMQRDVTFQDLQNMPYLEMVIKETLRIYPSAPIFGRKVCEDIEFEGHIIPAGTNIQIFPYGIHRDPVVYPDPEKFDPERFAGASDRSPYAYIPFSAGARNCIGQKFAIFEIKATLSKLLRNFEIIPATPKHELDLTIEIVLVSKNGVCVALKAR